jgi:hypothetical protein
VRAKDRLDKPLDPMAKLALATEIILLYAAVRRQLRRRPVPEIVSSLRARSASDTRVLAHPVSPYRLAAAVGRILGPLPADSRCLVRSLVLVGLLARRSVQTTLVIGVRPGTEFRAHAWVERDGQPLLPPAHSEFERLTEM